MNKIYFGLIITLGFLTLCCSNEQALFTNMDKEDTHISFINALQPDQKTTILDYLYYYNGGGVAIGDINNDGMADIFFTGNQVTNRLYLNKGGMVFEDISQSASILGESTWNTGVTMVDINGDGWLDIYVCAVVGINGFRGHNELYINNGNLTFTESSKKYGLDLRTYSSTASFFDYDLDGDLDVYVLNHAIHTPESFGKASIRLNRHPFSGDQLLKNEGGVFRDVSDETNILGGPNAYGLGLAVSDFNNDGFPDIFVGNDFHEDDYLYINTGKGHFLEQSSKLFSHTSRFSMGNDVADINADGFPDIFSADMLSEDETILKSTEGDEKIDLLKIKIEEYGYAHQYTRNVLQINNRGKSFKEIGLFSGVSATDWTWASLFADFDLDSKLDLMVTNGIIGRPNDLDYIRYISSEDVKMTLNNTKLIDNKAIEKMPQGKAQNRIFKGGENLRYQDMSEKWLPQCQDVSNGMAYGDLDNDGDLDLVINRLNEAPQLLRNNNIEKHHYIALKLKYKPLNNLAIGTKVWCYTKGQKQFRELWHQRGFQSSVEPLIHFGLGKQTSVDSIQIIWPNRTINTLVSPEINKTITVTFNPQSAVLKKKTVTDTFSKKIFRRVSDNLKINYKHQENEYIDFNSKRFIPYQITDRGPGLAVGDLNGDNKDDIVFGNSKYGKPSVFLQKDNGFEKINSKELDSLSEVVCVAIADLDDEVPNELLTITGGEEYYPQKNNLKDRIYHFLDNTIKEKWVSKYQTNGSVATINDFDKDGDNDVFIGGYAQFQNFGKAHPSYLLLNRGKGILDTLSVNALSPFDMVTDAHWFNIDNYGNDELIVVGEWMSPKIICFDDKGNSKDITSEYLPHKQLDGLWRAVDLFDIDKDGDLDILLGNFGLNGRFSASKTYPLKMYLSDFESSSIESIVVKEKGGLYYPLLNLDRLSEQWPFLRKKFKTYATFAGKTADEIFGKDILDSAKVLLVNELSSGYLNNDNGRFEFHAFPPSLQVGPINDFLVHDFLGNGNKQTLLVGNYFGLSPYHGKIDALDPYLIIDKNNYINANNLGLELNNKATVNVETFKFENKNYIILANNDESTEVYEIIKP